MFKDILGNNSVKEYLSRTIQRNTFGQSLLFAGPDGVGKSLFAQAVACHMLQGSDKHPDLHIYRPEGKIGMHSIEAMRRFSEEVYLAPYQSDRKIFIIQDAHRMLPTSANALLKTFEEPAENAVVILISSAPASLLPTVLSRCRVIYFQPLAQDAIANYLGQRCGLGPEQASLIASKAKGSLGQALRLAREGDSLINARVLDVLATGGFSTYKTLADGSKELAAQIDKAKEEIETELRAMRAAGEGLEVSAATKQAIEKEVEGALTMYVQEQMRAILDLVLSWYRDIELVKCGGRPELLYNGESRNALQTLAKGRGPSLAAVQKVVSEVNLALERSTTLNLCIESLFLKLNLIQ